MEHISVDFAHAKPKFRYFKDGNLVKQWSMKKIDTTDMICGVIDQQGLSNFDTAKMKGMVIRGLELFDPKTIKIVKKEV